MSNTTSLITGEFISGSVKNRRLVHSTCSFEIVWWKIRSCLYSIQTVSLSKDEIMEMLTYSTSDFLVNLPPSYIIEHKYIICMYSVKANDKK